MSDDDLVAACRAGDARAWSEVVERYQRLVRSIPRAYGLREHDIDEVSQLTFTILVQSLDKLRPDTRLAPWLSTVARRHTWRLLEVRRRETATEMRDGDFTHDDLTRHARQHADAAWVRDGLRQLSSKCRALLEALYLRGDGGYAEVAEELGIPIGSIGPTRARCLERLRDVLDASAAEVTP